MREVTKHNFNELYDQIEESLKKAVFISVDCEFSALYIKDEYKTSLFDTPSKRYEKTKNNLENSIPLQVGLTAFNFDRDNLLYKAKPYQFYIFPANFGILRKAIICESSAFYFLIEHHFDFHKVIYSGIPFINLNQEQHILKYINGGTLYEYCKYSMEGCNQEFISKHLVIISEWYYSPLKEQEIVLCDIRFKSFDLIYVLHKEIRNKFSKQLWTYEENEKFKVKRVNPELFKQLDGQTSLEKSLLTSVLGFTRIYKLLISLKKPIVGHNFLHDLVLLINTFDRPIPSTYSAFKQLANERFPMVFDTKTISFELFLLLNEDKKWKNNGLKHLYEYFKNGIGRHLVPKSPRIEIEDEFKTYPDDKFHDAGWDAYCTGYCFIRMMHFFAAKDHKIHKKQIFMSTEHLKAVAKFKSYVNLISATTPYLNLSGVDPVSARPPFLIIQSKTHKPIDIFKVTTLLRECGIVDIKPHSWHGRRVLVAVSNYRSARHILGRFQNHDDFKIITYNSIKHSPVIRVALWGSMIATGSVLAWLLHSKILKYS